MTVGKAKNVAQLVKNLPSMHKALRLITGTSFMGNGGYTYNLST